MPSASLSIWKIHREDFRIFLRFLYWTNAVSLAVICAFGLWVMVQPESSFAVHMERTAQGLTAFSFFRESFEIDFAGNVLNMSAATQPKVVFGIGFLNLLLTHSVTFLVLRNLRQAFGTEEEEIRKIHRKGIFRAGLLLILYGVFKKTFFTALFLILQLGGGSLSASWWRSILIGGIVICLSFFAEREETGST